MLSSITDILPPELQTVSVAFAGVLALMGLVLWSAGVRVARIMVSAAMGIVLACVAIYFLPSAAGLAVATSGILGLVVGVLSGAVAFRAIQAIAVGLCLGVAVGAGYYNWQIQHSPPAITHNVVKAQDLKANLDRLPATPQAARELDEQPRIKAARTHAVDETKSWWLSIPLMLRQGVLILGAGVAIVALAIAWILPRYTTWLLTASAGTALLLFGIQTLVHNLAPQYQPWVPGAAGPPNSRLIAIGAVFLIGLLMQRILFWPGRRQKKERQKDHLPQVAPA